MSKEAFKFIDLFAGIGGFRIPLEELGGKCVGFSEIDKKAIETYKANFHTDDELELGDITQLPDLPQYDLLVGGVPCQSWSVAGKMRGFDDPRGKLWEDTIRLVRHTRPRAFIFENVKGLAEPRHRDCLDLIVDGFRECGYNVAEPQVLNAYDFGVPQNRDRIIIVGTRNDLELKHPFQYPAPVSCPHKLYEVFDDLEVDPKHLDKKKFDPFELFGKRVPASRNRFQKIDEFNDFFIMCDTRNGHSTVHSWDIYRTNKKEREICLTILRNRRKKLYGPWDGNPIGFDDLKFLVPKLKQKELDTLVKKGILKKEEDDRYDLVNTKNSAGIDGVYRVFLPNSDIFATLTATGTNDFVATKTISGKTAEEYKQNFIEEIIREKNLRQISVREMGNLQGFPAEFKFHENEKAAKKQLGNAVPTAVVYHVAKSLIGTGVFSAPVMDDGLVTYDDTQETYKDNLFGVAL